MRNIVLAILLFTCVSLAAQDNGWKLTATDADAAYVGAPVANGGIGILPWKEPFFGAACHSEPCIRERR